MRLFSEGVLKRASWMVVGGVVLALVAAAITWALASRPTEVDAVTVDTREVVEVYVSTGVIHAPRTSQVAAEVSGRIGTVHVAAGQSVAAGQALVEVHATAAQLELDAARARLQTAQAEQERTAATATQAQIRASTAVVERAEVDLAEARRALALAQAMAARSTGTTETIDRAQSQVDRADASLAQAQAQLRELRAPARPVDVAVARARVDEALIAVAAREHALTTVVTGAPFAGLVLAVHARPGEVVAPGQTLVELVDLESREVLVEIDEAVVSRLAPGMRVQALVPAVDGLRLDGTVRQIGPRVDAARGVVEVHLDVAPLHEGMLPGIAVDVALELQRLPEALAIPRSAVARGAGEADAVFVIAAGVMERTPVQVVAEGDDHFAIEGVAAGALVLRDASRGEDGVAVRVAASRHPHAEGSGADR